MKNTQLKKNLILVTLFIALVVLMENTAKLYGITSPLDGNSKLVAEWFVGFSCEFAIFVCIYCGSSTAGIVFAILSFLVGMTVQNYNEPLIVFTSPTEFYFNPTNKFWASLLQQSVLSSIVWYLSELFVKFDSVTGINEHITKLNEEVTALEGKRTEVLQGIEKYNNLFNDLTKEHSEREQLYKDKLYENESRLSRQKEEYEKTERRLNDLRKAAISIQNSNNRRSTKIKE